MALSATLVRLWERGVRLLLTGVVALTSAGLVLGFYGLYEPWSVLPTAALLAVLGWFVWERLAPDVVDPHDNGLALVVALAGIVGLTVFHAKHSGNFLLVSRDPAFYNLGGLELARTGDLSFPGFSPDLQTIEGLRFTSQAFSARSDLGAAYSQSFHGLGAVMAPFYWVGGLSLFLKAPAVIGGIVLVAFRRLCARLVRPWVATTLTLALGVSIPFLVFVRDAYSEPLFLLFLLGALLVLVEGPASPARFALAGFIAGGTALGRIDSLVSVAGFVVAFVAVPIVIERRPVRISELVAGGLGIAVTTITGFVIGHHRSPAYFGDLWPQVVGQLALFAVAVVGAGALVVFDVVRRRRGWSLSWLTAPRTVAIAATATVAVGTAWWLLGPVLFDLTIGDRGDNIVSGLQAREGAAIDSGRTYGEEGFRRVALYYGEVAVLLAMVGGGLLVRRVLAQRQQSALVLSLVAATAVPYLFNPRIYADMPWAMRRFLPVVIPMTLILAGLTVDWLRSLDARMRQLTPLLLVAIVGAPAVAAQPVWGIRTGVPLAENLQRVCEVLPSDGLLLITDPFLALTGVNTFNELCGIETVALLPDVEPGSVVPEVARLAAEEGRVLGVLTPAGAILDEDIVVSERVSFAFESAVVQRTIEKLPAGPETSLTTFDLLIVPPGQR